MPSIPLIVVWFAVMSGYLPYSMGYSFLNPIILISYGFLGLLIGANVPNLRIAIAATLATSILAILVVNVSSGIPHVVIPGTGIIAASFALSITSVLATSGLRDFLTRKGWEEFKIRRLLRLGFAALALIYCATSYFPYEFKIWIAEHTTDDDLTKFGEVVSLLFAGIWLGARLASRLNPASLTTKPIA